MVPVSRRLLTAALAALVVLAVDVSAFAECVWKPVGGQGMDAVVVDWFRQATASNRDFRWSFSSSDKTVSVRLEDGSNVAVVAAELDSSCRRTVRTEWKSGAAGWFDDAAADRLIGALGLASVELPDSGGQGTSAVGAFSGFLGISGVFDVLFLLACVVFAVSAFLFPGGGKRSRVMDSLFIAALAILAALPVFNVPFSNDAPILRVAYSARDVFGDWNHPFLAYILNRPAALLSHDPATLRLTYFFWVVIEMFLFCAVARKVAGRGAAALVAIWMAISVRQTMGMVDLSDWNLAGIFLALMILWVIDYSERGLRWKWIPVPALLILCGYFASFLMSVPAGLLTLYVVFEKRNGRIPWFHAAAVVLAMAAVGFDAIGVFTLGGNNARPVFQADVWQMLRALFVDEPPFGLSVVMPVLVAGGFATRSFRKVAIAWLFCLSILLTALLAIMMSFIFSNVNGAYYFALFKGIGFVSAAALIGAVPNLAASMCRGGPGPRRCVERLMPAVLAGAVVMLTFNARMPYKLNREFDDGRMADFVELTGRGAVRVVTNTIDGAMLMEYQDVLAGRLDYSMIIDDGLRSWARRTVRQADGSTCANMPERFLLLWRNNSAAVDSDVECDPRLTRECRELFVESGEESCANSNRIFCYYDCVEKAQVPEPSTE